ncbi:MarR family winged helix-turn-helix transcriptional regulator [Pseudonocardia sp. ICBG1034]|uniref:MarR family winged helix-turn-helix transcriptional regulator n=1 Tax=Pseudonocardia sp. ICBG1034 TaxID=2844381 RepID=UPI001CCA2DB4|nr:MarR family transcriptional regulator [Pseudonocardia sp. ICBG1034]
MSSDPEPDCDLGWSIGMLQRRYRSEVDTHMERLPRGSRGYQLLYAVIHKELPNQLALSEYLGIDRTVLPYVIDDLVEDGLVERRPADGDRRARKIVATERGRSVFSDLEQVVGNAEDVVLGALAPPERDLFRHLLSRLARQARGEPRAHAGSETDL